MGNDHSFVKHSLATPNPNCQTVQLDSLEKLLYVTATFMCTIDREFQILDISPTCTKVWGYMPMLLIGRNLANCIVKEDRDRARAAFEGAAEGSNLVELEIRLLHLDGHVLHTSWSAHWDANEQRIYCAVRDITPQQYALHDLQSTADVVWEWDVSQQRMYRGEGADKLFGYNIDEVTPDRAQWSRHVHLEDRIRVENGFERAIADGSRYWEDEYRFVRSDGTVAIIHDRAFVVRNEVGEAIRVVGAMHDITQQRDEHQRLELLESVITNTTESVLITKLLPLEEPGPAIVYVNNAFTRMTGYDVAEVVGRSPRFLQGPKTDAAALHALKEAMRRFEPCEIETINYKKNGEEFWVNISVSPVADKQGTFTHYIAIERDVTERKLAELKKELLADIAAIFSRSLPLGETLNKALKCLSEFGEYDLAEAWLTGTNDERIVLQGFTTASEALTAMYSDVTGVVSVAQGEGLPGVTWSTGEVQSWSVEDASQDFGRRTAFIKAGLTRLYGLPLRHHDITIGVLILGTTATNDSTSSLTEILVGFEAQFCSEILRKRLEEDLHRVYALAPDVICIIGVDGYFRQVNPAMSTILGYSETELLEQSATSFVHPEDREYTLVKLASMAHSGRNLYFENRHVAKSTDVIWFAWTVSPATDEGHIFAVAKDITKKKHLEHLLEETARMAMVGSWEIAIAEGKLWWSAITRSIHEVDESFMPHIDNTLSFFIEEDQPIIAGALEECRQTGKAFDVELRIRTARGRVRWVRAIGAGEFLDGTCVKVTGCFQDVDDRRRAQEEVVQTLREKTVVLESIGDGFITLDRDWMVTYWNAGAERLFGTQSEDAVGKNLWVLYADAVNTVFYSEYHRAMTENVAVHFAEYYATMNRWFEIDAYPSAVGLAIYIRDVTLQRQADERLLQSNERFERVAQATNDAIWDWDLVTDRLYWGEGMHAVFGHSYPDGVTTISTSVANVHPDDVEAVMTSLRASMANPLEDRWQYDYRYRRADGSWAFVVDVGSVIRDSKGTAIRMVGALQDITYRKQYEDSLQVLNDDLQKSLAELERSNAELEQFAYVASHDLQEPLRMVTGFLSQLERKYSGQLDEKAHTYIHYATDGAMRMRQIILDLLEYSRAGRSESEMELVGIDSVLLAVTSLYERRIRGSGAIVTWSAMPSVRTNNISIRQMFQNLIGNALTYTRPGSVPTVEIACTEEIACWRFSIADNGIGISSEYFERVFQMFQRLHTQDEYAGTGIGLAICKKVVEHLGGEIWVESVENSGSTFFFTIPKQQV